MPERSQRSDVIACTINVDDGVDTANAKMMIQSRMGSHAEAKCARSSAMSLLSSQQLLVSSSRSSFPSSPVAQAITTFVPSSLCSPRVTPASSNSFFSHRTASMSVMPHRSSTFNPPFTVMILNTVHTATLSWFSPSSSFCSCQRRCGLWYTHIETL